MTPTLAQCLGRKGNDLAAVRILAAVAVLYAHAWIVTTPGVRTEDFFHVFGFSPDFHGVHAFFILSGLLLTRSLMEKPDALRFVIARLARYLPAIFAAACCAALVVGPIATRLPLRDYFAGGAPFRFIAAVTTLADVNATLPGVFEANREPGILFVPLWTIHYELVFALVLAVISSLGLLRRRRLVLAGLLATLAVNVVWFWNGEEHAHLGSPHHLVRFCSAFGLGIALAVFADKIPVSNRLLLGLAVVAAPLAYSHVAALAGMILIAYAMLCVGFTGGRLAGGLGRLGAWSYGFYVWGYLIEQTIAWSAPGLSAWAVWGVAFCLALAAGWLSWELVERPCVARVSAVAGAARALIRLPRRKAAPPSVPLGRE